MTKKKEISEKKKEDPLQRKRKCKALTSKIQLLKIKLKVRSYFIPWPFVSEILIVYSLSAQFKK